MTEENLKLNIAMIKNIATTGIVGCASHIGAVFSIMELKTGLAQILKDIKTIPKPSELPELCTEVIKRLDEWHACKEGTADGTNISAMKLNDSCVELASSIIKNLK